MHGSDERNSSKHVSQANGSPRAFGRVGVRALWERAELETGCVLAHLDLHTLAVSSTNYLISVDQARAA